MVEDVRGAEVHRDPGVYLTGSSMRFRRRLLWPYTFSFVSPGSLPLRIRFAPALSPSSAIQRRILKRLQSTPVDKSLHQVPERCSPFHGQAVHGSPVDQELRAPVPADPRRATPIREGYSVLRWLGLTPEYARLLHDWLVVMQLGTIQRGLYFCIRGDNDMLSHGVSPTSNEII